MDWSWDAISRMFWHHFAHLRVVETDRFGNFVRVLQLGSCEPCRRLWATLTPLTIEGREIFPAHVAERYNALGRGVYVRADVDAPKVAQRPKAATEAVSVQRVKRFTDRELRRPVERY